MAVTAKSRFETLMLYAALFGRAPDKEGMDYWGGQRDAGAALSSIATAMFGTKPARAYFPANATNQDVVSAFYVNVLGRQPDSGGLAYWRAKLDASDNPGLLVEEMVGAVYGYTGADKAGLASKTLFLMKLGTAQYYHEKYGGTAGAGMIGGVTSSTLNDVFSVIDMLAARKTELTLAAVGQFDLAGLDLRDLNLNDIDGGNLALLNVPGRLLANLDVAGRFGDVTLQGLGLGGTSDAASLRAGQSFHVDSLAIPGIEDLAVVTSAGPVTLSYTAINKLKAPDLRKLSVSGDQKTPFIHVLPDSKGLAMVDASGARGGVLLALAGLGEDGQLNVRDSPVADVITVGGGTVHLSGGSDNVILYPLAGNGHLKVKFDAPGSGSLAAGTASTIGAFEPGITAGLGVTISVELAAGSLSKLKVNNIALGQAIGIGDLFAGMAGHHQFSAGSNVGAGPAGSAARTEVFFDLDGDGSYSPYTDASITLSGDSSAGVRFTGIFEAAA